MSLGEELAEQVAEIFKKQWTTRQGRIVPESEDLALANEAVEFSEATVLYADISGSTQLVRMNRWTYAAEVYKSFLYCAARVIASEEGTVTAYDGDRVMAVFIGDSKNTAAARTALKVNYCVKKIVNPLLKKQYPNSSYEVRHVVGVDVSDLHVARTGVRGANDLVWVGRAANWAAKLTTLPDEYASRITVDVYNRLHESLKISEGKAIWEAVNWTDMNNFSIYRSTWWWPVT
jgi:class 3 adenylate cyclase